MILILLPRFFCLLSSRRCDDCRIGDHLAGKRLAVKDQKPELPFFTAHLLPAKLRIGWSHQISSSRFPEFDSVAFRVTKMSKPPIRVDRVIDIDDGTCSSKLCHHRIQVPDSEIDSPSVVWPSRLISRRFGGKDRRSRILPPRSILVSLPDFPDAQMLLIPLIEGD